MRKIIVKLLVIAACLAILAVSYFFIIKPKFFKPAPKPISEVSIIEIKKHQIQLTQELPARVAAFKISEVRPQVDGVLQEIKFSEGSFVKQGQQLYQIDPTIYKIAYDNALANLKTLQSKRERYKQLIQYDAISKQEYDDLEAAYTQANANLRNAQSNISYAKVLAPISGIIGKSNITPGTLVSAGQPQILTTIVQLDPIYVDMAQPSKEMLRLGDQNEIAVTLFDEEGQFEENGILKFSELFANPSTDSVRLRAIFPNKNNKLIPGMFVTAKLHLKPIDAITVPQRATMRNPDGSLSVFVIDENSVAKIRVIKAEKTFADEWIVEDGLNEGDKVVMEGYQKIADNLTVKTVPYQGASQQASGPKSGEHK